MRFHSASARAMSSCSALDLARQTAMSDATSFTSIFSIAAAAAIAAARSPSRSPPVFLFFGSFFAVSRAGRRPPSPPPSSRGSRSPRRWLPSRTARNGALEPPPLRDRGFRSDFGAVTSKYFTHTSSPATRSRAARVNIVCPIRSLHAFRRARVVRERHQRVHADGLFVSNRRRRHDVFRMRREELLARNLRVRLHLVAAAQVPAEQRTCPAPARSPGRPSRSRAARE